MLTDLDAVVDAHRRTPDMATICHGAPRGGQRRRRGTIAVHKTRRAAPMPSTVRTQSLRQRRRRATRGSSRTRQKRGGPTRRSPRSTAGKRQAPVAAGCARAVAQGRQRQRQQWRGATVADAHPHPRAGANAATLQAARTPSVKYTEASERVREGGGGGRGATGMHTTHNKRTSKVGSPPPLPTPTPSREEKRGLDKTARRRRPSPTAEETTPRLATTPACTATTPSTSRRTPPPCAAATSVHSYTTGIDGRRRDGGCRRHARRPTSGASYGRVWSRRVWAEGHTPRPRRDPVPGR